MDARSGVVVAAAAIVRSWFVCARARRARSMLACLCLLAPETFPELGLLPRELPFGVFAPPASLFGLHKSTRQSSMRTNWSEDRLQIRTNTNRFKWCIL